MSKLLARAGALVAVAAFSASVAVAAPDKKAAMPNCTACKMPLVAKKDKTHTTAVKIKGKTYYCCDKCPMGATKKK